MLTINNLSRHPPPSKSRPLIQVRLHQYFARHLWFLCRLRSIVTHRDHFVRRLSVRLSVCPSVTLAELCFAGDTCIPRNAVTIFCIDISCYCDVTVSICVKWTEILYFFIYSSFIYNFLTIYTYIYISICIMYLHVYLILKFDHYQIKHIT